MWASVFLCLLASLLLSAMGSSSPALLFTGTGLLGVGMASIFATGFLWTEQRITVTSKVSWDYLLKTTITYYYVAKSENIDFYQHINLVMSVQS